MHLAMRRADEGNEWARPIYGIRIADIRKKFTEMKKRGLILDEQSYE